MHEWFAQPIATGRMAAANDRATVHRLRVVEGRDVASRIAAADRGPPRPWLEPTAAAARDGRRRRPPCVLLNRMA